MLWIGLCVMVVVTLVVGVLQVAPVLAKNRKAFDLIAMLSEIDRTNADIKQVNAAISTSLEGVKGQVGGVVRVHQRLSTMDSLLGEQNAALDRLKALTVEQAGLSRELQALTAQVQPSTAAMARTARVEAGAVESMGARTEELAVHLRTIRGLNAQTAGKLERAEVLSAKILLELP